MEIIEYLADIKPNPKHENYFRRLDWITDEKMMKYNVDETIAWCKSVFWRDSKHVCRIFNNVEESELDESELNKPIFKVGWYAMCVTGEVDADIDEKTNSGSKNKFVLY